MRFRHSVRLMRATMICTAAAAVATMTYAALANEASDHGSGPAMYTIGLFGDMPYNALGQGAISRAARRHQREPRRLLRVRRRPEGRRRRAVRRQPVHDGDRELQQARSAAHLGARRQRLDRLLGTLRPGHAAVLRSARAPRLRATAVHSPPIRVSVGRRSRSRASRAKADLSPYSENVRWKLGPVVYIGLNVQGSNDNYPYRPASTARPARPTEIARQRAEEIARKAADLHWLHEGFDVRRASVRAKGVMVIWQADPNFNNEQHLAEPASLGRAIPTTSTRFGPRRSASTVRSPSSTATATISRWTSRSTARRRRARELHPRRDLRRAQHALGERADRPGRSEPVRVRTTNRRGQRPLRLDGSTAHPPPARHEVETRGGENSFKKSFSRSPILLFDLLVRLSLRMPVLPHPIVTDRDLTLF